MPNRLVRVVGVAVLACAVTACASALADAAPGQPITVTPEKVQFKDDPRAAGVQVAVLAGDPTQAGTYVTRVKLAKDAKLQPHMHPETRYGTVISGTIYFGFGPTFDAAGLKAYPAGSLVIVPANAPHYLWSKDGEVIFQDVGEGPTGTKFQSDSAKR